LAELCDYLRVLDLAGVAPQEFGTLDAEVHDHVAYIQRADSDEAAPLFRDDCAPGFRDDLAPLRLGSCWL
jgi:hypothetical protein